MPMNVLPSANVGPGGLRPPKGPRGPRLTNGIPSGPVAAPGTGLPGPGALSAPTALVAGAPKPPGTRGLERPRRAIVGRAKTLMKPKKPKMPGMGMDELGGISKLPRNGILGVV